MMDDSRSNIPVPVKLIFLGTAAAAWAYAVRQKRRMEFAGKVVVISGASRGLGLELARGFAREKANIALLARDQEFPHGLLHFAMRVNRCPARARRPRSKSIRASAGA